MKVVFDEAKLKRDIEKASKQEAEKAVKRISTAEKLDIGEALIDEMKVAISKGISPIKDAGRFPPYKWANAKTLLRETGSKAKDVKRAFQDKYPYSARKKFPDKKERPVNLKLSGSFLRNLKAKVLNSVLYIGFFEEPWSLYEQGHREGVNEQPQRPIIPTGEEQFSQSIYRRLVKALQEVFDRQK